jgi:glycosyltransferase involved in cell wall biosynthesis
LKFGHYIIKRKLEAFFIYPFIAIGRLIAWMQPVKKAYENYYFFPFYHTGGAEKIHALVAQATGGARSIIYFTRTSHDKNFYEDFVKSGSTIKDISTYTDNKFLYFINLIYRGYISSIINSQKSAPLIFNGQCNFAYKIAPWIKKEIPQVELIHSFNTFSWIRLPFLPFISQTVMISQVRIEDHLKQYQQLKVPDYYNSRIQYIVNGIPLPSTIEKKDVTNTIKILYAGRGTEEKRVNLVAKIAERSVQEGLPVEFLFMGDVLHAISPALRPFCTLIGQQADPAKINEVYRQAHVVIITSYTEGFPLVIEEGMSHACAVIATPVGDIPIHVKHNENGFLFSSVWDEAVIVAEGVKFVFLLLKEKALLLQMGETNREYAYSHFSIESFNEKYQQLFKKLSTQS